MGVDSDAFGAVDEVLPEAGADAAVLGAAAGAVVVAAGATGVSDGASNMTAEICAVMEPGANVPPPDEPDAGAIVNDDTIIARLRFSIELKKLSALK